MEAMVVSRGSPVRKHYLVSQLKRLRAEARLSQEQVAEEMGWDVSKLYRIENGRFVRLNPESVAALCRLYGADDGLFEELVAIAKAARRHKPWWSQFEEGAGNDFYSVEYEATLIEEYAVGLVPELVQHPDYWAALVRRRVPAGSAEYQKLCAALRQRQAAVLERDDPPRFWSVVDESALRCAVGGPQVMRAQLTHLLELVKHPNLVIQVLPLSAGRRRWVRYSPRSPGRHSGSPSGTLLAIHMKRLLGGKSRKVHPRVVETPASGQGGLCFPAADWVAFARAAAGRA